MMKAKTETKPTITLHKGGTSEKTIPLSQLQIPDLWHIAQAEQDLTCKDAILRTWHYAHHLKRELEDQHEIKAQLLDACNALYAALSRHASHTIDERDDEPLAQARAAIAKAGGRTDR